MTIEHLNHTHYDAIIIGAGAAGSTAVNLLHKAGKRVALIERDDLGGTCLNYGCDPTKTMLHAAKLLWDAQHHAPDYGVHVNNVTLDWEGLLARIAEVQRNMRGGTRAEARRKMREQGIDLVIGEAGFVDPHTVEVTTSQIGSGETQRISADQFLLATGVRTDCPPINGLAEAGFITNREAVQLAAPPKRLGILGSGPLGVEFAQMFNRFGTQVTAFDQSDTILSKDDDELSNSLQALLEAEGITFHLGATVRRVEKNEEGKRIIFQGDDGSEQHVDVDEILLSAGRTPNIDQLHLDAAGVDCDAKKGILTDDTLRTNVSHIWAAGDVTTPYKFTHIAEKHGEHAAQNMLGNVQPFDFTAITWATYTSPELAHIGQSKRQLDEEGIAYSELSQKFSSVPRAQAEGKTEGQIKLLVGDDGKILGAHVLGHSAGELLAPVLVAMRAGMKASALGELIFPYPTLSEAVGMVAKKFER